MAEAAKRNKAKKTKKTKKVVSEGILHVNASFNNTIITVTDRQGNALRQASAGSAGFGSSRKRTTYAAEVAASGLAEKIKEFKMERVTARVKGPGPGRESAVRAFSNSGIKVTEIEDRTPVPHNGCRPSKKRRV